MPQLDITRYDQVCACIFSLTRRSPLPFHYVPPLSYLIDRAKQRLDGIPDAVLLSTTTPRVALGIFRDLEREDADLLMEAMDGPVRYYAGRLHLEPEVLRQESVLRQLPTLGTFHAPEPPDDRPARLASLRRWTRPCVARTALRLAFPHRAGRRRKPPGEGDPPIPPRAKASYFTDPAFLAGVADTFDALSEYTALESFQHDLVRIMAVARRNPEHCRRVEAILRHDTLADAAHELGLRPNTLARWLREFGGRHGLT